MKKILSRPTTRILKGAHAPDIRLAARLISRGRLVAIPTETVYGLAALGHHQPSIDRIYHAKNRPAHNPLILHVHSLEQALTLWDFSVNNGHEMKSLIVRLAHQFWPGPLTLIAPKANHILPGITAGLNTLAIRCPAHPVALALLQSLNEPLAAPSANLSNRPSPTCAGHVMRTLSGRIHAVLNGGSCAQGIESTVLDVTRRPIKILRAGSINAATLEKVLPNQEIIAPQLGHAAHLSQPQRAPGQQGRHYAPAHTRCFLVQATDLEKRWGTSAPLVMRAKTAQMIESKVGFRPKNAYTWSMPDEPATYGQALYRTLYEIENSSFSEVWVEEISAKTPHSPWWVIQDRWVRASKSQ